MQQFKNRMAARPAPAVLALALLAAAGPAPADDTEREALARLAHEIDALAPLVDEAQSHADRGARVGFRYDWLRQDLARVRQGILDHVHAPRAEPRQVPPLQGDYRR